MRLPPSAIAVLIVPFSALSTTHALAALPYLEPSNRIDISITATSNYSTAQNKISLQYKLKSKKSSIQKVDIFAIRQESPVALSAKTTGWRGDLLGDTPYWSWAAMRDSSLISPGMSANGYLISTNGLPCVQPYYAQGDTPVPAFPEELSKEDSDALDKATDFFSDSVHGFSVGASNVTVNSPVSAMVQLLLTQTKAVADLGWIDNRGIENSLEKKLNGALDALNKGKTKTARNKLKAFLHEVIEKSGRHEEKEDEKRREREEAHAHIKQNAVAILATDAEVAIYALGGDPKKHEDGDDDDD